MSIKVSSKISCIKKLPKITKVTYLGSTSGFKAKGKPIYTVTSIQADTYLEDSQKKYKPRKHPTRPRCWGWLPSLKEAKLAVKHNAGDMAECCYYSHAVIEEIFPGIPSMMFSDQDYQIWYEWKVDPKDPHGFRGKWVKCKCPKWATGICGWGI
jgi:hypothetical protein